MKCICDEFHISISELINGERQISLPDKENVAEKENLKTRNVANIILELSKHENMQKTKAVTFYFSLSFVFSGIILLQTMLLTFEFIETPFLNKLQTFFETQKICSVKLIHGAIIPMFILCISIMVRQAKI